MQLTYLCDIWPKAFAQYDSVGNWASFFKMNFFPSNVQLDANSSFFIGMSISQLNNQT